MGVLAGTPIFVSPEKIPGDCTAGFLSSIFERIEAKNKVGDKGHAQ